MMIEHFIGAAAALVAALLLFCCGYSYGFYQGYNTRLRRCEEMMRRPVPPLATGKRPQEPWMIYGHGIQHWK